MRNVEAEACPRFDLNLTMSPVDSERLARIAPGARIWEVPNAVDLDRFSLVPVEQRESEAVVFIGPTYLFANRDAIDFLLRDIWPRVRERRPTAQLTLVGRNAPGQKEMFARIPGVTPLGRVETIQPYVGRAACSVIPIRVGGGTRIKILESWALGTPIVTTSIGGEGLEIKDGENALVRDNPAEFADAIVSVLEDQSLRSRLGQGGRSTVEALYNWKKVGNRLRLRYEEIITRHQSDGRVHSGTQTND